MPKNTLMNISSVALLSKVNEPSRTSKDTYFQNEAECSKGFSVKMSFICMRIKQKHFQINNFALNLALKQRLVATRKWPFKATDDIIARIML